MSVHVATLRGRLVSTIRVAESDEEIVRCFPVMHQLRPQLDETTFVSRVRVLEAGGYRLAFLDAGHGIFSVAGYRLLEKLGRGRILLVDELVTDAGCRSLGYGQALFRWLVEHAKVEGCQYLELDSGVQRFDAHRFYLTNHMHISSHHFRLEL